MRFYLAARYSRRAEMLGYAAVLELYGHEVVSTWIDGHHETRPGIDADATDEERRVWATEDVFDVKRSDVVVSFTDQERGRGGRHVEFGLGLAWKKRLVLIGPYREHIFHCLYGVERFATWEEFLTHLLAKRGV